MPRETPRAPRRSPDERRAEIAAAARALALADGLAALTLRAVATRARVTPALVAHYVPSMDELVAHTFSDIVRGELAGLPGLGEAALPGAAPGIAVGAVAGAAAGADADAPAPPSVSATARLGALLRALLDGTRDDVTLVWVEAFALGRRNETLAVAARDAMDRWQHALHDLLAQGIAEGAFRVDDPDAAAWQIIGMIDGLNAQALVRWGGASDRSALMLRAVEGMLRLDPGALDATPLDDAPPGAHPDDATALGPTPAHAPPTDEETP